MKVEKSIRDHYVSLRDVYDLVSEDVGSLLNEACALSGWNYSSRIKEMQSYALKLATSREVDDFFGCSIVVPTLAEVPAASALVASCFDVIDKKPNEITKSRPTEFPFDSLRLYCKLKKSVNPTLKHNVKFEVQIKTLLEQAWSQATHDFSYKGNDISWAKERVAAQLKAMLDNVELSISQIASLSSSPNLIRKNLDYESRAEILAYLRDDLGSKSGVFMPADLRRLTDIVHGLLKFMRANLEDLRQWLLEETRLGRGVHITDLSAYSIILQSAMNQSPTRFIAGLKSKNSKLKVFVTEEVTPPRSIDLANNPKVVRLQPVASDPSTSPTAL